jgi:hypothetical protein
MLLQVIDVFLAVLGLGLRVQVFHFKIAWSLALFLVLSISRRLVVLADLGVSMQSWLVNLGSILLFLVSNRPRMRRWIYSVTRESTSIDSTIGIVLGCVAEVHFKVALHLSLVVDYLGSVTV